MSDIPSKLDKLRQIVSKMRTVEYFKDTIKAEDDNLKTDAFKTILDILDEMSDRFSYGNYLSKLRDVVSKLKYVKDCPYKYEICLGYPEYFVPLTLHLDFINALDYIINALKNLEPPCPDINYDLSMIEMYRKFITPPRYMEPVPSSLHNNMKEVLNYTHSALKTLYEKCYAVAVPPTFIKAPITFEAVPIYFISDIGEKLLPHFEDYTGDEEYLIAKYDAINEVYYCYEYQINCYLPHMPICTPLIISSYFHIYVFGRMEKYCIQPTGIPSGLFIEIYCENCKNYYYIFSIAVAFPDDPLYQELSQATYISVSYTHLTLPTKA